jgi:hypothetical protein
VVNFKVKRFVLTFFSELDSKPFFAAAATVAAVAAVVASSTVRKTPLDGSCFGAKKPLAPNFAAKVTLLTLSCNQFFIT